MSTQYLVRFDDICPTMDWTIWEQIEKILTKHNIKPILAVVPDNQDPNLVVDTAHEDFWQRVQAWQSAGWTIALHGYQHVYSTPHAGLMGTNNYSEFTGLTYEEQKNKLDRALAIFAKHNVRADAWIAPAHSFDEITVKALLESGINVISDGYFLRPVKRLGALWIPQQLWRFRPMRFGLWTVCFHHNNFSENDLKKFEFDIEKYCPEIITFDQAIHNYPAKDFNFLDKLTGIFWHYSLLLKKSIS